MSRRSSTPVLSAVAILIFLGLLMSVLMSACGNLDPPYEAPDTEGLQGYFEGYLQAVNAGDEASLQTYLDEPGQAAERIDAYRGLGLRDPLIEYRPDTDNARAGGYVTMVARTRSGATVELEDVVAWKGDEFAESPNWHWEIVSGVSPIEWKLVGTWRETGSGHRYILRVRRLGPIAESSFRITYRRFYDGPQTFIARGAGSGGLVNDAVGGECGWVDEYFASGRSGAPDVIHYEYPADTVTIVRGSTGERHELVRAK